MANNHNMIKKIIKTYGALDKHHLCDIIITSVLSEKSVFLEEKYNTIILKIDNKYTYNKQMIKLAVEAVFSGVTVISVNVANYKPITKRFKGKPYVQSGYKKAYIRLTKDSEIQLGKDQTAITKFTNQNNDESNNQSGDNQQESN